MTNISVLMPDFGRCNTEIGGSGYRMCEGGVNGGWWMMSALWFSGTSGGVLEGFWGCFWGFGFGVGMRVSDEGGIGSETVSRACFQVPWLLC